MELADGVTPAALHDPPLLFTAESAFDAVEGSDVSIPDSVPMYQTAFSLPPPDVVVTFTVADEIVTPAATSRSHIIAYVSFPPIPAASSPMLAEDGVATKLGLSPNPPPNVY